MLTRTLCPILIDRAEETSALQEALLAAHRSDGRVVIVAGDAGIGKSRLVSELCARAEADGMPVLRGGCSESDLQVPYLPFIEAIRNHFRRNSKITPPPDLAYLFGHPAASVDPMERRIRIFEAVLRLLEDVAATHGAVLNLEDLHWSDSGTRDLLDYVARSLPGSRMLVVATYRGEEVDRGHPLLPLLRGWVRRGLATLIELRPLSPDGIAAMLEATIGRQEPSLARRLHQRSEGNPFVLEEILKTGGIDLAEPTLPATVRDTILRRVERLEPGRLEVLRAAAVLGEPIDDDILVGLLGEGVSDALEECVRQQLLTALPSGAYAWRHALTREAVYHDMAPARRRHLHSELADLCDGRPDVDEVAICGHLAAAGRWDAAVPRCRHAAAATVSIGAFADAADLLELCLPHVDERSEQAGLLEEIAELRVQSGSPDAGETSARQALELRGRVGDPGTTAVARGILALSLWQQARWAEAIDQDRRAIAELESGGPTLALVAALARLAGWTMLGEADLRTALKLVERARRVAEAGGLDPALYRADEGQVLACAGQVDEGLAILDGAWRAHLGASEGRGTGWREAKFMLHHAVAIRALLGRTNDSLPILAESRAFRTTQDVADVSLALVESVTLWAHGEIAEARRLADSLNLVRLERALVPWSQCLRADLLVSQGDLAAAAVLARTALPPHWQPASQLIAAGLIHILVSAGDITNALNLAGRLGRLGGYGIELRLPFIDAAVEAHLAAGQGIEAAQLAAQVAEATSEDPMRLRVESRMLLASGAAADATERLRRAAEGFVKTGHRQNEWEARRLLAGALRKLGQRREAQAELQRINDDMAMANGTELPVAALRPALALSPREREVALLVVQGLRNREIAERLFISERTVENHIHRILERNSLRSRAELAARVSTLSGNLSGSPR